MSNVKAGRLILNLIQKSNDGKLDWEPTESEGVFQCTFPEYSIRVIEAGSSDDECILICIINGKGEMIERISHNDLTQADVEGKLPYSVLTELYHIARRRAMGFEQAIDSIMKSLNEDLPF